MKFFLKNAFEQGHLKSQHYINHALILIIINYGFFLVCKVGDTD